MTDFESIQPKSTNVADQSLRHTKPTNSGVSIVSNPLRRPRAERKALSIMPVVKAPYILQDLKMKAKKMKVR